MSTQPYGAGLFAPLPEHDIRQVSESVAILYDAPFPMANRETELPLGWPVYVHSDGHDGWLKVTSAAGDYPGYMRAEALKEAGNCTHRVSVLHTIALGGAQFSSLREHDLWHNSLVRVEGEINGFSCVEGMGWVPKGHLSPILDFDEDPVVVARLYLGSPYYWAGMRAVGIDCSGLVQQVYLACGIPLPRNASQQHESLLGRVVSDIQAGDLMFFKNHVVICSGDGTGIHANGDSGNVREEPLASIIARRGNPIDVCRPTR